MKIYLAGTSAEGKTGGRFPELLNNSTIEGGFYDKDICGGNNLLRRGGEIMRGGIFNENIAARTNILESFYYIADWQTRNIHNFKSFMLDSGAFTFVYGSKVDVDIAEYFDKYKQFVKHNDIDLFFELDIDEMVGYDEVLRYRKELERFTGKQCIPVWHINRGKEE